MVEEAAAADEPVPAAARVLFPSPVGVIGVEARGEVITRVAVVPVGRDRAAFPELGQLKQTPDTEFLEEVVGRMSEYFAGARRRLDLAYDLTTGELESFARRVLKQVARTPYGRTRTHQDVASAVGRADGYRQVLSVLVNNPLPILVPCHRIVPSKTGVGSWVASAKKKEWLLRMEAAAAPVGTG